MSSLMADRHAGGYIIPERAAVQRCLVHLLTHYFSNILILHPPTSASDVTRREVRVKGRRSCSLVAAKENGGRPGAVRNFITKPYES